LIDAIDHVEDVLVISPHDADDDEADSLTKIARPEMPKFGPEVETVVGRFKIWN
jgi:hypothetical protein